MPRPGPRPYECIRRAWHSDSHHPMRGSLIQEIFRIADEIHNSTTRRNKEWQKKLPLVVLRAEEILYSKANSEAEYMDLKTLRFRLEDAVNTMIRRDETAEDGQFLEPCVEAALYVGCPPRKTARSQRHNSRFCAGSNQRVATSSAVPIISKCNTYEGHTQESRFSNADYCGGVSSSIPSIDPQQYSILPVHVTAGCPSSAVCTQRVDNKPHLNETTLYFSNPCSRGHMPPLGFNQSAPPLCNVPSIGQRFGGARQQGVLVQPSAHQTGTEGGSVCMPMPWHMSAASASSSMSNPWGVQSLFPSDFSNDHAIGLSSNAERLSSIIAESPIIHVDAELHFQVPSMASQSSHLSGFMPAKHVAELASLNKCKYSMQTAYNNVQNNSLKAIGDFSAEIDCKMSPENSCDLHLRLGPSSNPCFYVATNGSCEVEDLESSNCRARAQFEDQALESLKVNDSFGSGSYEASQEVPCFSPSLNSSMDVSEAFPGERKGPDVEKNTIQQAIDVELPIGKRRRCDVELTFNQLDDRYTGQQHDNSVLQIGLGLSLSGRGGDT